MRKLPQCSPGFKRCGRRCVNQEFTCAEDKEKKGAFSTQNLALLGGAVGIFAGITLTAVVMSRSKNEPKRVYLKPIAPVIDGQSPSPPIIKDHKRMGISPEVLEAEEFDLTPQQRHDKAVRWAQGVVDKGDSTFILDFETSDIFEGVNPLTDDYSSIGFIKPPGVVQIALNRADGGESYNIVLNPEELISPLAQRVHRLGQADVEGQPTFKDVYPFLKKTLEGKDLLAFNNRFDAQLMDALCEHNGLEPIKFSNRGEDGFIDNEGDIMHQFALYNGRQPSKKKNLAYAQLPRRKDLAAQTEGVKSDYDPYADLPRHNGRKPGGLKEHDALEDVYAATELIYRMATNAPIKDRRSPKWQLKKGYEDEEA